MARIARGQNTEPAAARNSSRPPWPPVSEPRSASSCATSLPNLLGVVIVYATLLVPSMIIYESFISFLGLGRAGTADQLGRA